MVLPSQTDKKQEISYLSSAVNSINPWASSRTTTANGATVSEESHSAPQVNPDDHSTTHLYGLSFKTYPPDCPALKVHWFHAIDVPKRKPQLATSKQSTADLNQPLVQPKKFSPFSISDSKALENEYQRLLEEAEAVHLPGFGDTRLYSRKRKADTSSENNSDAVSNFQRTTIINNRVHVPVNEDFSFDVDIAARELAPVYWLGSIYEVRRGTWFYQDGSNLRPCEENLAAQLEEGYLKLKPWLYSVKSHGSSCATKTITPKVSREDLKTTMSSSTVTFNSPATSTSTTSQTQLASQPQTYRLFGTYMNSIVTYQDSSIAWLSSDSVLSWVTSSVYERFAGGGYLSGVKFIRGFTEPNKAKETNIKAPSTPTANELELDEQRERLSKQKSAPPIPHESQEAQSQPSLSETSNDPRGLKFQRQLSSLLESDGRINTKSEEEIRRQEEQQIQDDYNAPLGETQGREIEHLVLVTHGIGQLLSLRMESVNFVHDVNILRKTIKSVYASSADLKALNSELGTGPGNSQIQVLPVCWRHLLDFPRRREKQREHDLGESIDDQDDYPSLEDITVEGVTFARSLISDLALDVLLYQSSYREQIAQIVSKECNRIFKLFKKRNPEFKGKIHLLGHSLGSAILFDVLCQQREPMKEQNKPLHFQSPSKEHETCDSKNCGLNLEFEVEHFFCLGSPIGLFQMLKGRTIAARPPAQTQKSDDLFQMNTADGTSSAATLTGESIVMSSITGLPTSVSSPKVRQLYNIFHPSDPISYRLEPLISPSMSALKPQLLPYTKKGIFGTVAPQGLTGIGARVGQSVSGLWSSLSAGIASNILNRGLGVNADEVSQMATSASRNRLSMVDPENGSEANKGDFFHSLDRNSGDGTVEHDPTVTNGETETLFSKFQQRQTKLGDSMASAGSQYKDRREDKVRIEESKIRALNRNGRVDYSIQE